MNKKRITIVMGLGMVAILLLTACASKRNRTESETAAKTELQQLQWEQMPLALEETKVKVFVCGAVLSPGVVELHRDSRVQDALEAAGGFTEDASRDYLNLAGFLTDGEKLYFPTIDEVEALREQEQLARSGLVDINTADEAGLCTLPGIGESRAADIIRYREEQGPFASIEELREVDCITANIYEKLAGRITVGY